LFARRHFLQGCVARICIHFLPSPGTTMTTITINPALQSYIDPLTASEYAALERSLLAEGCRDALVLWNGVLIDGHNRYAICTKHQIPFATLENASFETIEDVMLWIIDNHLARRSVSDFQRGVLALRKKEIVTTRIAQQSVSNPASVSAQPQNAGTREETAQLARLSNNTMVQIEKIQKAATPELVQAVRSGTISINAAATVASLPEAEQLAAVAGGKKQLQQAAREVREQKARVRAPKPAVEEVDEQANEHDESSRLRAEIASLQKSNAALKAENAALEQRIAVLVEAS
jgi:hypothetical protein